MKVKAIKKDHAERLVESIRKAINFSLLIQEQIVNSYPHLYSENPQAQEIYDEHCIREETLVAVMKALEGDFIDLDILSGQ